MQGRYLWMLVGLFFVGIAGHFLLAMFFYRTLIVTLALAFAIGIPLCFILRARLVECGFSPRWALLGLLPAIGFPVGLILYFCAPAEPENARH